MVNDVQLLLACMGNGVAFLLLLHDLLIYTYLLV